MSLLVMDYIYMFLLSFFGYVLFLATLSVCPCDIKQLMGWAWSLVLRSNPGENIAYLDFKIITFYIPHHLCMFTPTKLQVGGCVQHPLRFIVSLLCPKVATNKGFMQ